MYKVNNIIFYDPSLSRKIVTFLSLIGSDLIAFKTFIPPTIMVVTQKDFTFFLQEIFSFFFDNLRDPQNIMIIQNSYITQEEYERMVIEYTEDIETNDFIITPRIGNYNKTPLYIISVNFAQGTGAHPTTKMILDNLKKTLEHHKKKTLIIDYGSGSGILSIASKKILSKSSVLSIEINFRSLIEAKRNYILNKTEIFFCLSNTIQVLNLTSIKQTFDNKVLIINVPLYVIEKSLKYLKENNFYFDILMISGIKKPKNIDQTSFINKLNQENFDNYLDNYEITSDCQKDWILIIAKIKT
ncbi:MAG: 50S ribosomal protein L11 methyltransferase [Candidatus Calescibacterium sp.]|nr:50S ribosomal protein L11 methyltransferase [Candidatus Calescibacterium sp.]MCX7972102.1 50S ribosomal protein L11 methyltransferase [bacterium]MDW8194790.1 50S ribosomal protein L11 methyltransferase [Candidatus Calescibacterium sp.]